MTGRGHHPASHSTDARERALAALDAVGMAGREDAYPSELSGGQQQRVAIARALAMRPRLMLFDEPTSMLDPELVGEVLNVVRWLAHSGITMIVVTHELGFAREACDTLVFMDAGRIVEQGSPAEVIDAPHHERTREFMKRVRHYKTTSEPKVRRTLRWRKADSNLYGTFPVKH